MQHPATNQSEAIALPANSSDVIANSYLQTFDKDLNRALNDLSQEVSEGFSANQISAHYEKFKNNLNEVFGGKSQQDLTRNVPPAPENIHVLEAAPEQPNALIHSFHSTDSFERIEPIPESKTTGQMGHSNFTTNIGEVLDQERR